jgi:hypothetical protein
VEDYYSRFSFAPDLVSDFSISSGNIGDDDRVALGTGNPQFAYLLGTTIDCQLLAKRGKQTRGKVQNYKSQIAIH